MHDKKQPASYVTERNAFAQKKYSLNVAEEVYTYAKDMAKVQNESAKSKISAAQQQFDTVSLAENALAKSQVQAHSQLDISIAQADAHYNKAVSSASLEHTEALAFPVYAFEMAEGGTRYELTLYADIDEYFLYADINDYWYERYWITTSDDYLGLGVGDRDQSRFPSTFHGRGY